MTMHPAPGFTGSTLERLDHERDDEDAFFRHASNPAARLLRLNGLDPCFDDQGALDWGGLHEAPDGVPLALLGLIDGTPRFAALAPGAKGSPPMAVWQILSDLPPGEAATFAAARSLVDWHARHRFCANCGTPTTSYRAGWARRCDSCATEHFPRTDPVVIMLAEHQDRVLLGHNARFPMKRFSALAGFVEVGESLEEAVSRELFEEAGVRTISVRYLVSQPWPYPSQLMLACIAPVESDALTLDAKELDEAIWVTRDEVRAALAGDPDARILTPPPLAIAHTLLSRWVEGA